MEKLSLYQAIKKALDYYDDQNIKYIKYIRTKNYTIDKTEENAITICDDTNNKIIGKYQIIGTFDNSSKVWVWGWLLPIPSIDKQMAQNLLSYGLKLDYESNLNEHQFIKSLLINSRILIEEDVQLYTNIAIYSYLLKDNIKFIYPVINYIDDSKKNYIIIYYGIQ